MQHGQVDMVIVGADRVSKKGDACNKIGTYLKALAAKDNKVPFYVAIPSTTIDWEITDGVHGIPIELRDAAEVASMQGLTNNGEVHTIKLMPATSKALNPAFDVTPADMVTQFITEHGVYIPNKLVGLAP